MTDKKTLFDNSKAEVAAVCLLFVMGTVVYFLLGNFSKAIEVYMDELFYYDMARGIFNGNGFAINNYMFSFEKIAYALVLMPFFAIRDITLRISVITFVNSVLMMSCVFPVWLIAKKLDVPRTYRYVLLLITVLYPDMMFSMTFMSEVLYWPLLLWFAYVWLLNAEAPRCRYAVLMAVLAYAAYLCKEVALALPLANVAFLFAYPLIAFLAEEKPQRKKLAAYFDKKALVSCGIFLVLLGALFIVVKLTVFSGGDSNYDISKNSSLLTEAGAWLRMAHVLVYYIAALIIACFVFPVIYPLLRFRKIGGNGRKLYCFAVLGCLVLVAAVIFTISVGEVPYSDVPRTHLRYFGPFLLLMFLPFFACFGCSSDHRELSGGRQWLVVIAVTAFACVGFSGVNVGCTVDQSVLNWYRIAADNLQDVLFISDRRVAVYMSVMIFCVVCLLHYAYTDKRYSAVAKLVMNVAVIGGIAFGCCTEYAEKKATLSTQNKPKQYVLALNEYFSAFDEYKSILYIDNAGARDYYCRCMDTYFDYDRDLYFAAKDFADSLESGVRYSFSELELKYPAFGQRNAPAEQFEYIIVAAEPAGKTLANVQLIPELSNADIAVYKNLDKYSISFGDAPVTDDCL